MGSWDAPTPTPTCKPRAFSTSPTSLCSKQSVRATPNGSKASLKTGAINPWKQIGAPWYSGTDIDLIDIASPNDTHAEIAIAAAKAGKMVLCEKPLGRTGAEAKSMVDAVQAANVPNMVWYNYRRVPAVVLLKQLLDQGRFGRIFHYRSNFLQDWTISSDLPQGGEGLWRLDVSVAGSGVTGDLLAHNIDMALWLNGPITEVTAMTETFVKQRKHNLTGKVEPVGIDDASPPSSVASPTDRWRSLKPLATPEGTRRSLLLR